MDILYNQLFKIPAYPVASFVGQTVIVTGSNVGLGLEAARHFVRLDAAKVISRFATSLLAKRQSRASNSQPVAPVYVRRGNWIWLLLTL